MHTIIRLLNIIFAGWAYVLAIISYGLEPADQTRSQIMIVFAVLVVWIISSFCLTRVDSLWAWVGSLLSVSVVTLWSGQGVLMILGDTWRFQYGDRTVHLDPSTHGIPLIGASIVTMGLLLLLAGLLSLPAWRNSRANEK